MAKAFKRHESGGSFKRPNIGDGGVRAYKEQQDQIIEAEKFQRLRSEQYAEQFIKGKRRNYEAEEQNRQQIKNFENKLWQNTRDAIVVKSQREVENLKSKADEYGREAKYWEKFSTTYSKEWGKLAQGLYDYGQYRGAVADRANANQKENESQAAGNIDLEITSQGIESYQDQLIHNALYNIKDPEEKLNTESRYHNTNPRRDLMEAADMEYKIGTYLNNLESKLLEEPDGSLDDFGAAAQELGIQLELRYKISQNSEGGRKFREIIRKAIHLRLQGQHGKKLDTLKTHNLGNALKSYQNNPTDTTRMILVGAIENKYGTHRMPQATALLMAKYVGTSIYDIDEYINNLATSAPPDSRNKRVMHVFLPTTDKGTGTEHEYMGRPESQSTAYYENTGWKEKFFKGQKGEENWQAFRDQIEDVLLEYNAKEAVKEVEDLKAKGRLARLELEQRFDIANRDKENYIDLTTLDGWNTAVKLLEKNKAYAGQKAPSNPLKLIADKIGLKPGQTNLGSAENDFLSAYKSNDFASMRRAFKNLSRPLQDYHRDKLELTNVVEGTSMSTPADSRKWSQQLIQRIRNTKGASLTTASIKDYETIQAATAAENLFYSYLNRNYEKIDKYKSEHGNNWNKAMVTDALASTKTDVESNKGLWERKSASESADLGEHFIHFQIPEPGYDTEVPTKDLYNNEIRAKFMAVKNKESSDLGMAAFNEDTLDNQKLQHGLGRKHFRVKITVPTHGPIASKRNLAEIAKRINAGEKFVMPANIKLLSMYTGYPELKLLNQVLKDNEFKVQAKPGIIEQQTEKAAKMRQKLAESISKRNAIAVVEVSQIGKENQAAYDSLSTRRVNDARMKKQYESIRSGQSGINPNTGNTFNQLRGRYGR